MKPRRKSGLHVETLGTGPDVVMLHGWAMHGGVLRDFAERLSHRWRITLVDLPGHGNSGLLADYSLASVTEALLTVAPPTAHWIGWSLGALLSIAVAIRKPGRIDSLTMIAGSPRFTAASNWPGLPSAMLAQMGANLEHDYARTLQRFIGLQTFGHENARGLARRIHTLLDAREPPEIEALRGGLHLLEEMDLRADLANCDQPVLCLLGAYDRLVPRESAPALRALSSNMEVHQLRAATHLPFLTHPEETCRLLHAFLDRQTQGAV
jgi:pimeloyl-[acyl-carrier protein] methyl ester esterase